MRVVRFLLLFALPIVWPLKADSTQEMRDLIRIHRETIGGSRLDDCRAIEVLGVVQVDGRELKFEMVAARPNRIRLTMQSGERTLVQATDGVAPPWQSDSAKSPTVQTMNPEDGREFTADAEFDDPLTSAPERGYALDYAGEIQWEDRRILKILVTRHDSRPSFLLIDPETYFIVARQSQRRQASGREVTVETRYSDFQPTDGVIFPHRMDLFRDGVPVRQTVLTSVRLIPEPPETVFARPMLAEPGPAPTPTPEAMPTP